MFTGIVELRDFYESTAGRAARDILRARLLELWPDMRGQRLLGFGYAAPLLRPFLAQAEAVHALMPAAQGVAYWPREGPNRACLTLAAALPLPDESVDRIVALHALEGVADTAPMLRELWRVLKAGGHFVAIVPNRRGLLAHGDRTPFGFGQPFSPRQLRAVLNDAGFRIERARHALYLPPALMKARFSGRAENALARLFPGFGGVLMVEAGKRLYAPVAAQKPLRQRLVLPLPLAPARPVATRQAADFR